MNQMAEAFNEVIQEKGIDNQYKTSIQRMLACHVVRIKREENVSYGIAYYRIINSKNYKGLLPILYQWAGKQEFKKIAKEQIKFFKQDNFTIDEMFSVFTIKNIIRNNYPEVNYIVNKMIKASKRKQYVKSIHKKARELAV